MEDIDEGIAFLQTNEGINGIGQTKEDSHPTKQRVRAFKSRVFGLLLLFVEKSKNLAPLFNNLSQQLFLQQPQKMQQLLNKILNRGEIESKQLQKIGQYYKTLLMYKSSKNNQKFIEGFIRIIRIMQSDNAEYTSKILKEMLQVFLTKRKCKLQAGFFPFLLRRLPQLKTTILEHCIYIQQNEKLRPAQQRVLLKLKKLLLGKQAIKIEANEDNKDEQ